MPHGGARKVGQTIDKIQYAPTEERKRKHNAPFRPENLKPKRFMHYLTISEVAKEVRRDVTRIRALEAEGKIPEARRVRRGKLMVRLWSPEQVEEIKQCLKTIRPGNPGKNSGRRHG